jgi:hypothetical protein
MSRNHLVALSKTHRSALLASLLKDIKSERAKVAEKDHLRLLYVTKWFLAFFRLVRTATGSGHLEVTFGMVAEVTERGWIAWVLKRMREAVEQKVFFRPVTFHPSLTQLSSPKPGMSFKRV